MHPSAITRITFLLCTLPPSVTRNATEEYDALMDWALASVIAGEGAGAAGLGSPDEVQTDYSLCLQQFVLGSGTLRQAHLSVRGGELGLNGSAAVAVAA